MTRDIPLMAVSILPQDIREVGKVLKSGFLVQGKKVEEMERCLAGFLGVPHAIAVSNGTATMHLALKALGIGAGDEVIVPAFSYIATANVVELTGATPVFVDIDIDTFNIQADKIEAAISPKTKAIMPVHEFGLACDIHRIAEIARKHRLFLIEDAACALGAKENGKYVGSFGDFGSFSFHPRKAITSGEGGLLTTREPELAHKVRVLRNHGIEASNGHMEFIEAGFNYRMTEMQAALISSQMARLERQIERKNKLAGFYGAFLRHEKIKLPQIPEGKNHTWQTYHVVLQSVNRDEIIARLKQKGIGTNYGAQCIPAQQFYRDKYKLDYERLFPNSWLAYKQGLALPMFEKLTKSDIKHVAETLISVMVG